MTRTSPTDRALRVLADHGRAMTFLLGDGVVPSNEDRGYVLRRIMRRAIQQGRGLGLEPGFLERYADVVTELMGSEYPELGVQRDTIHRWMASEEESFGRTLEQGLKRLDELIARARDNDDEGIAASDAFLLHDTYGFPIDLTLEIVAEHGLGVDEEGFESLMEEPAHTGARGLARRSQRRRLAREGGRAVGRRRICHRVRRLRDHRRRDHDRSRGLRQRRHPGQAGRIPVLRHRRRPGRRHRRAEVRERQLPRHRHRRDPPGHRPGGPTDPRARQLRARRARPRPRRPRRAPRHRLQPHRHAPAPRLAAQAPGHARAPGGLLRGA